MKEFLDTLNPSQIEAVKHIEGSMLILAGAGSGKTKTITTRLAYLIDKVGINPANTLTLTFTNKSALEMKSRALGQMKNNFSSPPLLCTFHKFGLLFLKFHISRLNRKNNFVIIDTDDRKKLLKKIVKELRIDIKVSFVSQEISKYKNSILSPKIITQRSQLKEYQEVAKIYELYQQEIESNNLVDFDDLLMLTYKILKDNDDIRVQTSNKYKYIMVDEYQDTNELQYRLLQLLASEHNNLCVVGDDDQSIYGWRGANVDNILNFPKQFENCKIVKLEINYRSTKPILDLANNLIEYNTNRLGKTLISNIGDGEKVEILHSIDEVSEARHIARKIKTLLSEGTPQEEIAVLYRINALSRSIEEGFMKEGLGFKLLGGMRFYERAEIKDIISYLRVISNPNDNFSITRIINKPRRGIGKASLEKLEKLAYQNSISIFKTIEEIIDDNIECKLSKAIQNSLKNLHKDILSLQKALNDDIKNFIDIFEDIIDLKTFYQPSMDVMDKILNIDEFYAYFREAVELDSEFSIDKFLNNISLQSDQDQIENNTITIMSIHASKGLEFENLFVIGLEEEFFPIIGDSTDLEEERRLAYVAITRAKYNLTLSYVDSRFYQGKRRTLLKSRFLGEAGIIQNSKFQISKSSKFNKGDIVKHKIFGIGRIQAVNKSGKEYKLLINFGGMKKTILSSFVKAI